MKRFVTIAITLQLFNPQLLFAQKCVNPHFDAQRLDYRDIGYPGATEIPADSSPITALLSHSNGKVYGVTSGKKSHFFAYDSRVNKVFPLGGLPKAQGVHGCLAEGKGGVIYIGTGKNEHELLVLSRKMPEGSRCSANLPCSLITVCPALPPP